MDASQDSAKTNVPSRDYLDALVDSWNGRTRTAIEHVTQVLATQPDHEDVFPLYRLWIELLAEEGDVYALRSLGAHLLSRAEVEPKNYRVYFAMRGLIHLELDEAGAVELMINAQNGPSTNPYVREFAYRSAQRMTAQVSLGQFISNPRNLRDYFHWQLYTNILFTEQRTRDFKTAVKRVNHLFPGSPLVDRIEMHDAFEKADYTNGVPIAERLFRQFPSCVEFGFAQAFGLTKLEQYQPAIALLNRLIAIDGENDVDVVALIGHCYKEDFLQTKNERSRERAGYFLKKAENMLTAAGLPAASVSHDFTAIRGKNVDSDRQSQRAWLMRVPQSEYLNIQMAEEDDVRFLTTTVGPNATPGDLCFLVTEDYRDQGSRQWRIGAIYAISSEPKWHPMFGTQSVLSLIGRPAVSLPIDISISDRINIPQQRSTDNAVRAFELDGEGLEQIMGKMEEYFNDDAQSAKMFAEFNRGRVVS